MTQDLYALKMEAERQRAEFIRSFIGAMILGLVRLIPSRKPALKA